MGLAASDKTLQTTIAAAYILEPDNNPSVISKVALIVISFGKRVSEPG